MASSGFEHNFGSRLKQINFNWLFLRLSIFSFPFSSLPEIFSQGHVLVLIKAVFFYHCFPLLIFELRGNRTAHWWSLRGREPLMGCTAILPFKETCNLPTPPGAWSKAIIPHSRVPAFPNSVSPPMLLVPLPSPPRWGFFGLKGSLEAWAGLLAVWV